MKTLQRITIVGGCGHVGLPLGIVFASKGLQVDLLDIDPAKVDLVNSGKMPFMERGADDLLRQVAGKSLNATLDPTVIKSADAVVTVVGTPVDRHLNPTVGDVYRSIDALLDHMQEAGLGNIAEIFDGNAPHRPVGCFAQAWSVSEVLRAYDTYVR